MHRAAAQAAHAVLFQALLLLAEVHPVRVVVAEDRIDAPWGLDPGKSLEALVAQHIAEVAVDDIAAEEDEVRLQGHHIAAQFCCKRTVQHGPEVDVAGKCH